MEPNVISSIGRSELDTILELKSMLEENSNLVNFWIEGRMENQNPENFERWACDTLIDTFADAEPLNKQPTGLRKSLLSPGCYLAKKLRTLPEEKRWKTVAQIWVEMLSFAAINNRNEAYVQQLSKGGQLISFVWLLMLHMGLGIRQFQKDEKWGPARSYEPMVHRR